MLAFYVLTSQLIGEMSPLYSHTLLPIIMDDFIMWRKIITVRAAVKLIYVSHCVVRCFMSLYLEIAINRRREACGCVVKF